MPGRRGAGDFALQDASPLRRPESRRPAATQRPPRPLPSLYSAHVDAVLVPTCVGPDTPPRYARAVDRDPALAFYSGYATIDCIVARERPTFSPAWSSSSHVVASTAMPVRARSARAARSGSPGTSTGSAADAGGEPLT